MLGGQAGRLRFPPSFLMPGLGRGHELFEDVGFKLEDTGFPQLWKRGWVILVGGDDRNL